MLRFELGLYPTRPAPELARLAALAVRTERVRLGSAVTTGLTRHPTVTASAALSVAELTGGRFDLGLGSGDSSLVLLDVRSIMP